MNLLDDMAWVDNASCASINTECFFVEDGGKRYENESYLKRVCSNCLVQPACLNYSLHNAVVGWWGGTSERNRRSMRQRLGIIAKSVASEGDGVYK